MNINGLPQNPVFQSVSAPVVGDINGTPGIMVFTGTPSAPYIQIYDYSVGGVGGIQIPVQSGQQLVVAAYNTGGATIQTNTSDGANVARFAAQVNSPQLVRYLFAAEGMLNSNPATFGVSRQGKVTMLIDGAGCSGILFGSTVAAPIHFGVNSNEVARIEVSGGLSLGRTSLSANAWDGTGIVLYNLPGRTYTDRTSTGVKVLTSLVSFFPATITATSGAAYTDLATFAILGAPGVGANTTGVNRWAAFLSGDIRVDGNIVLGRTSATTGTKIGYSTSYIQFNSGNGNLLYQGLNPAYPVGNVTGNFTLTGGQFRYVWTGSATWTGTLPSPSTYSGMDFLIKNISSSSALTVSGNVDYGVNYSIPSMQTARLWSDNNSWLLI